MDELRRLVDEFRSQEADDRRGPCFSRLAHWIESLAQAETVSGEQLVEWIGRPDLWVNHGGDVALVYRFDHEQAGRNRHEWYFRLRDGKLTSSGYNEAGINDLSEMLPGADYRSEGMSEQ